MLNSINILLADDDVDDCAFFEEAVVEITSTLTKVYDGEQLMKLLISENYIIPDILFLDINMPRKNGFECLFEIKKHSKLKNMPVIIFSTSLDQEVVSQLYKMGAQFFIRKPANFLQYKRIILHTLSIVREENVLQPLKEDFVLTMN